MGFADRQQARITVTQFVRYLCQIVISTPFLVGLEKIYLDAVPRESLTLIDNSQLESLRCQRV